MENTEPISSAELRPAEQSLVAAMKRYGFGHFEGLTIRNGEPVLDPWPVTVRGIKFAHETENVPEVGNRQFKLKHQVVELLQYTRSIECGEIRLLEFRHGLPFSMEIEMTAPHVEAREIG